MTLLNTVDTYLSLQPFTNVEQLNKNTVEIRNQFADQMTLSTKKVLDVLHRYAVKYPGVCYLSKNKIAEMVGVTRMTVVRACKALEELGVIVQYELKRHNGDRRQSSNAIVFVSVEEEVKADEINNVTPECYPLETLSKTQKILNNTLDTEKPSFDNKSAVKESIVDNNQKDSSAVIAEVKRGLRDKMPAYIYDTLAPYFNLDDLYQAYGALIRGKAYIDKTITFEMHEHLFKDAILSVINAYKRGVVRNLFAVMYAAARDTSAQIVRKAAMDSLDERIANGKTGRVPFYDWLNDRD